MNSGNMLGALIKEKRIDEGYSIRKLADLVGVSSTELTRIESGERVVPNLLTLIYICKELHMNMENILRLSGFIVDKQSNVYEIDVSKILKKKFYIVASNDNEAFDNLDKYIKQKGVYNLSDDGAIEYKIVDKKKILEIENVDEIDEDFEEELDDDFCESGDCFTCKHYCPLCDECIYGED